MSNSKKNPFPYLIRSVSSTARFVGIIGVAQARKYAPMGSTGRRNSNQIIGRR